MTSTTPAEEHQALICAAREASDWDKLRCPCFQGRHCVVHGAAAQVREDGHHAVLCPCKACWHPDDEQRQAVCT